MIPESPQILLVQQTAATTLGTWLQGLKAKAYGILFAGDGAGRQGQQGGPLHHVLQLRRCPKDAAHAETECRGKPHLARADAAQH